MGFSLVGIVALDLAFTGPYVRWFNHRYEAEAKRVALIGKPEAEIVKVFGSPSRVDDAPRAYVYYPYPLIPISQVKVFCEGGRVIGVKLFDD